MAKKEFILEEIIDGPEGRRFSVSSYVEYDGRSQFSVHTEVKVRPEEKGHSDFCKQSVSFAVSNPIDIISIAVAAATTYGTCVGWKMTKFTIAKTVKSYHRWGKDNRDSSIGDRIQGVGKLLASSSEEFREQFKKSSWDCFTLGAIFSNEDED